MPIRQGSESSPDDSAGSAAQLLLSAKGITKSFSGVPALRDGRLQLRGLTSRPLRQ
jgi:hypothetical protein